MPRLARSQYSQPYLYEERVMQPLATSVLYQSVPTCSYNREEPAQNRYGSLLFVVLIKI